MFGCLAIVVGFIILSMLMTDPVGTIALLLLIGGAAAVAIFLSKDD